jgi:hypothetical protein
MGYLETKRLSAHLTNLYHLDQNGAYGLSVIEQNKSLRTIAKLNLLPLYTNR